MSAGTSFPAVWFLSAETPLTRRLLVYFDSGAYNLRRSAIRNMRLAGVEESIAMKISGHRTRAVFDRYDIVGPRDIRDAATKMERRLSESLGTISGTIALSGPGSSPVDRVNNASKRVN